MNAETLQRRNLVELAERLHAACEDFKTAAALTVSTALRIGELLTLARDQIAPGEWMAWLDVNFPFSISTASVWIRLYEYRHLVADAESPYKAAQMLRFEELPVIREYGSWTAYPDWMREEAARMVGDGRSQREVADRLDVSSATISRWLNPDKTKASDLKKKERRRLAAERQKQEQAERRAQAARSAGGSIAKAYSSIRLHLQALDAAIIEVDEPDVKRILRRARNAAHQAEDRIAEALGVS